MRDQIIRLISIKEHRTMLATSRNKVQNQYLLAAIAILVLLVLTIVIYQSGVLPTISIGQAAATVQYGPPGR